MPEGPDYSGDMTDTPAAECAWYPAAHTLVLINNTAEPTTAAVRTEKGTVRETLPPHGSVIRAL